jgi:hypothetical protein
MNTPYNKRDHNHCWTSDNPPCGIKGQHRCCLCMEPVPDTNKKENNHAGEGKICPDCIDEVFAQPSPRPEWEDTVLDILHQVVPHTPLKLSETQGTDYDRGYVAYQDMMLRALKDVETELIKKVAELLETANNS